MSDVRLSNGSPTLERTEPRLSERPKPSACRSLFAVDHDELRRDLKGHLREMEDAASAKWGFDFANHVPLANSRFEWELVDCNNIPDFYGGQTRSEKGVFSAGNNNVDLNGNHRRAVEAPSGGGGQTGCTEQCAGLRKRPACHDPSAQNKRSHPGPDEVSCPSLGLGLGLGRPVEHTPRKSSPKRQT
ncbi:cyclin dependent kinase inhibitor 1Bb [Brachionichthys hirsutus]|uniref:cyclin dependent kinase inhibitor 1Bb n=1 Tax=Brachionichthys hirsutus TaxID=412623 RepID=UPI00360483F4